MEAVQKERELVQDFFEEFQIYQDEWKNAKIKDKSDFYNDEKEYFGTIYRVYEKNEQRGFIIYIDGVGVVQATFEGEDPAKQLKGKVNIVEPGIFVDEDGFTKYLNSGIEMVNDGLYKTGYAWFVYIDRSTTPAGAFYAEDSAFDIDTGSIPNLSGNYVRQVW